MRTVCATLGELKVSDLDEATITKFIRGLSTSARNRVNVRTKLSQFLNFCRREGKWIATNPAEYVTIRVGRHEVTILTVSEIRRLLAVAASSSAPESIVPFLSLQLYAGLRPSEAARLHWESVHFETSQIEVRAETSKTRETRFVHLEPTLVEILMQYRRPHGLVVSSHPHVRLARGQGGGGFQDLADRCVAPLLWLLLAGGPP